MKEGIHPNYQPTTIKCACGEVIETRSTKQDIKVEICSKCHPFFTGKLTQADVLTSSRRSTILTSNEKRGSWFSRSFLF